MKFKLEFKDIVFLVIIVLLAAAVGVSTRALASGGDDITQSNDNNLQTAGDIVGGDSLGIGLANSLGDVDISGCVVTKQFNIIVYARQSYEYDIFCLADKLDAQGKYTEAAALRCSDKATKKLFGDSCITTWTTNPAIAPSVVATPNQPVETSIAHDAEIAALEKRLDDMDADHKRMDNARAANIRRYEQEQAEQKEEPRYSAEQEAEVYKILGIKKESGNE